MMGDDVVLLPLELIALHYPEGRSILDPRTPFHLRGADGSDPLGRYRKHNRQNLNCP